MASLSRHLWEPDQQVRLPRTHPETVRVERKRRELRTTFLSKEEAEELYRIPKRVAEPDVVEWRNQETGTTTLEIRIELQDGTPLVVRGWYSRRSRRYGLALLFRGAWVRRWDDHQKSRDPKRRSTVNGPHKHRWNPEEPEQGDIYGTADVNPEDVNRAVLDFLRECNVDTAGLRYSGLL